MTLRPPHERGRRHGRHVPAILAALAAHVATVAAVFCAWRPLGSGKSTALEALKRPVGYYRRPLRPSRFEDGPDKEGEGRGEWQGDAGKFTVNWGDPRIGRQGGEQWEEESFEEQASDFQDEESEEFEERPKKRRAPRRQRRMRTRSMEEVSDEEDEGWVERRESWRPPVLRRESQRRGSRWQSGSREPMQRREPRERRARMPAQDARKEETIKLDPPARPVNLEAMAQKGLPIVNLYQLEPNDFYFYLIRELGIERMHAKIIRHWLFTKGVQDWDHVGSRFFRDYARSACVELGLYWPLIQLKYLMFQVPLLSHR